MTMPSYDRYPDDGNYTVRNCHFPIAPSSWRTLGIDKCKFWAPWVKKSLLHLGGECDHTPQDPAGCAWFNSWRQLEYFRWKCTQAVQGHSGKKCTRMGHPLKLPSPTKLTRRLGHFPPASQAGRLAGPVFYTTSFLQCCGTESGSTGSTCFWPSWIRIRILLSLRKIVRKTLISTVLWLLFDLLPLKNDVKVPSKSNKQKHFSLN